MKKELLASFIVLSLGLVGCGGGGGGGSSKPTNPAGTGTEKPPKPDVTKPDKPDVTKPDKPDTTEPDTTEPDTTKPDTTKPEVHEGYACQLGGKRLGVDAVTAAAGRLRYYQIAKPIIYTQEEIKEKITTAALFFSITYMMDDEGAINEFKSRDQKRLGEVAALTGYKVDFSNPIANDSLFQLLAADDEYVSLKRLEETRIYPGNYLSDFLGDEIKESGELCVKFNSDDDEDRLYIKGFINKSFGMNYPDYVSDYNYREVRSLIAYISKQTGETDYSKLLPGKSFSFYIDAKIKDHHVAYLSCLTSEIYIEGHDDKPVAINDAKNLLDFNFTPKNAGLFNIKVRYKTNLNNPSCIFKGKFEIKDGYLGSDNNGFTSEQLEGDRYSEATISTDLKPIDFLYGNVLVE